jgi:hypothetical protein
MSGLSKESVAGEEHVQVPEIIAVSVDDYHQYLAVKGAYEAAIRSGEYHRLQQALRVAGEMAINSSRKAASYQSLSDVYNKMMGDLYDVAEALEGNSRSI